MRTIRFKGVDRNGSARCGNTTTGDLPGWVRKRYGQGWRSLTVTCGEIEAAGIGISGVTCRRMWWVLPDDDLPKE